VSLPAGKRYLRDRNIVARDNENYEIISIGLEVSPWEELKSA
jgi:hypothetical protein